MIPRPFLIGLLFLPLLMLGIAAGFALCGEGRCDFHPTVASFEECEAAGYPIMESYPRRCRSSDGVVFVEDIDPPVGAEPEELSIEGIVDVVHLSAETILLAEGEEIDLTSDAVLSGRRGSRLSLRDLVPGMRVRVTGTRLAPGIVLGRELRVVAEAPAGE
jgi:hypothetical protein